MPTLGSLLLCVATPGRADPRADVDRVALAFDRAQLEQDATALARLAAPNLIYLSGKGERADRAAFLKAALEPVARLNPFAIVDRQVVMLGDDAAAVSGLATVSGAAQDGTNFNYTIRYLDVFKRTKGNWQVVLVQVTPASHAKGEVRP